MDDDVGISDIIKNAAKGDEKRASFVYLMEKYRPKKNYFKNEEEAMSAVGFCVRFRQVNRMFTVSVLLSSHENRVL